MIKIATVFSGIGAVEQALIKLNWNHRIVFACDNGDRSIGYSKDDVINMIQGKTFEESQNIIKSLYDETGKPNLVKQTYFANYDIGENHWFEDIRFLDGKKYNGKVDILVGGSPCQSFSVNGKRIGLNDTRGTLFYEYARLISEIRPKCFIYENVKGMITHDQGNTWDVIKECFNSLNYDIHINCKDGIESPILNSMDYGIPQNRQRLFVIGIRRDLKLKHAFTFPEPYPLTTKVSDYYETYIDAKYYLGQKGFEFVTTHPSRAQVNCDIMRCQKANQQFNWNGDFIFESYEHVADREDILSKAYIGEWHGRKGAIRKFTPRECLRLMGFPDSFKIIHSDQEMYKQTGNSIVVNVLVALLKSLHNAGVLK